jgi:beta-1,4-N-acetylglucosaminyltransferase
MSLHVFVTVGTTRFDELIRELLRNEDVFMAMQTVVRMQVGKCDQKELSNISEYGRSWDIYQYKPSLKDFEWADVVISHAGSGSILESLRMRKACLAVINERLMDNHQNELAYELAASGYLIACTVANLREHLITFLEKRSHLKVFPEAHPERFLKVLHEVSQGMSFKKKESD